jgi:hypothetical protein
MFWSVWAIGFLSGTIFGFFLSSFAQALKSCE